MGRVNEYRRYDADVRVRLSIAKAAREGDFIALVRSLNRGGATGLVVPGEYLETVITKEGERG